MPTTLTPPPLVTPKIDLSPEEIARREAQLADLLAKNPVWPPKKEQRQKDEADQLALMEPEEKMPEALYQRPTETTRLPLLADPPGCQTLYGGKPGYVGAECWYIHTKPLGVKMERLIAVPAMLFQRSPFAETQGHPKQNTWMLRLQWTPKDSRQMLDIAFSETPQFGCWCWPLKGEDAAKIGLEVTSADKVTETVKAAVAEMKAECAELVAAMTKKLREAEALFAKAAKAAARPVSGGDRAPRGAAGQEPVPAAEKGAAPEMVR